jgi:hypothetical protein
LIPIPGGQIASGKCLLRVAGQAGGDGFDGGVPVISMRSAAVRSVSRWVVPRLRCRRSAQLGEVADEDAMVLWPPGRRARHRKGHVFTTAHNHEPGEKCSAMRCQVPMYGHEKQSRSKDGSNYRCQRCGYRMNKPRLEQNVERGLLGGVRNPV